MRFQIRISPLLRPILLVIGATSRTAYAELTGDALRVRFGYFAHTFPLALVEDAEQTRWPWYGGYGLRTNFFGRVGLVGSGSGVVRIRLTRRQKVRIPFSVPCESLYLSLEEPDRFLAELREGRRHHQAAAETGPAPG